MPMPDPTPEERTTELFRRRHGRPMQWAVRDEIRAAVAANTERRAKVNCVAIECSECGAEPGDYCAKMYAVHEARWRAAIRRGGEEE